MAGLQFMRNDIFNKYFFHLKACSQIFFNYHSFFQTPTPFLLDGQHSEPQPE